MVAFGLQNYNFSFFCLDDKIRIMVDEAIDTETFATLKVTCPELHALQISHIVDDFALKAVHIALLFIQRLGQT